MRVWHAFLLAIVAALIVAAAILTNPQACTQAPCVFADRSGMATLHTESGDIPVSVLRVLVVDDYATVVVGDFTLEELRGIETAVWPGIQFYRDGQPYLGCISQEELTYGQIKKLGKWSYRDLSYVRDPMEICDRAKS